MDGLVGLSIVSISPSVSLSVLSLTPWPTYPRYPTHPYTRLSAHPPYNCQTRAPSCPCHCAVCTDPSCLPCLPGGVTGVAVPHALTVLSWEQLHLSVRLTLVQPTAFPCQTRGVKSLFEKYDWELSWTVGLARLECRYCFTVPPRTPPIWFSSLTLNSLCCLALSASSVGLSDPVSLHSTRSLT